jgi:ankyrin repeat protein
MGIAEKLINSLDSFSMTPMHLASISFDYEIFSSLINLKPDLGIKDHEGKTAFDHLKENEEIESELIDALSKVNLK